MAVTGRVNLFIAHEWLQQDPGVKAPRLLTYCELAVSWDSRKIIQHLINFVDYNIDYNMNPWNLMHVTFVQV